LLVRVREQQPKGCGCQHRRPLSVALKQVLVTSDDAVGIVLAGERVALNAV